MRRCHPNRALQSQLEVFFGGKRCIVSGSSTAEWHHLDDNSSNTLFENLVPLSTTFNLALRDVVKRAHSDRALLLPPLLQPGALLHQARLHFGAWEPALAYGCARLGFFISRMYLSSSSDLSILIACDAHHFVRHALSPILIKDILDRDLFPCLKSAERIDPSTAVAIFQESAALYGDFGEFMRARELYDLIDRIHRKLRVSPAEASRYAAILRREAMARGVREGLSSSVKARLDEATRAAPGDENTQSSVINTRAWLLLDRAAYVEALDLLEPYYKAYRYKIFAPSGKPRPVSMTAWNAAELIRNYAIALTYARPTKYRQRRENALHEAQILFEKSGSRPFDIRPGFTAGFREAVSSSVTSGVASIKSRGVLPAAIEESLIRVVALAKNKAALS